MSQITDFIDSQLIPSVFDSIDRILPEFEFKRSGGAWVSSNRLRVSGSEGSKPGSVYVYPDRPYLIKDYSSGPLALTTYLQESPLHKVSSWLESVKYLADQVGLSLPERNLSPEEREQIERANLKTRILEEANDYFIECLSGKQNNIAHTSEAEAHRKYLEGRGYGVRGLVRLPGQEFDPKASYMELGFVPSQAKLKEYLVAKGFTEAQLEDCLFSAESHGERKRLPSSVGSTHRISIPFRDPVGRIKGFAFRTIDEAEAKKGMKYIYTPGSWRSKMLFNLRAIRGDQDLVIVEGLLDALYARGLGRENVVALGGASMNGDQLKAAVKYGAKTITLCLDSDEAGEKATASAIELITKSGEPINLYVAVIPPGYKDPDELIREKGIEAFDSSIRTAQASPRYQVSQVTKKILSETKETYFTDKEREQVLSEVSKIGETVRTSSELEAFQDALYALAHSLDVSKETLDIEIARVAKAQAKTVQASEVNRIIEKAKALVDSGKPQEAAEVISKHGKQLNKGLLDINLGSLLKTSSREEMIAELRARPESVASGFKIGNEELVFPAGAISIFAAPTSHGKTTALINTALNVVDKYDNKRVYLFSFEESKTAVFIKAFNVWANLELSKNNRRTIESYFREGTTKYFSQNIEAFETAEKIFFDQIIEAQRFHVVYEPYNSDELIQAIHYIKEKSEVSAVFIDYMQLLSLPENRKRQVGSRQEELKQICLDLKDCANETGLPIILGAQFNREVKAEADLSPTKIGEAGDIERIANVIVGMFNRNFPGLDREGNKMRNGQLAPKEPRIYMEILKNRDGGVGENSVLDFNGNTGRLSNKPKPDSYEQQGFFKNKE